MTLRKAHGSGPKSPRIEVLPVDELPAGVPGPPRPVATRDGAGRFVPGSGTQELARKAAAARHESRQMARLLGLREVPEDHPYAPYARLAREWRDDYAEQLAASVGGGQVDAGAAMVLSSSALQFGSSRYLYDQGMDAGDAKLLLEASRLADASRQNLLAAFELAAKAAKARVESAGDDLFHAQLAFQRALAERGDRELP